MKTQTFSTIITFSAVAIILVLIVYGVVGCKDEAEIWDESWLPSTEKILADANVVHIEDCLSWAFGPDYHLLQQSGLDDRWRQRHSDLFIIHGYDDPVECTKRIAKAWLDTEPN